MSREPAVGQPQAPPSPDATENVRTSRDLLWVASTHIVFLFFLLAINPWLPVHGISLVQINIHMVSLLLAILFLFIFFFTCQFSIVLQSLGADTQNQSTFPTSSSQRNVFWAVLPYFCFI